MWATDYISIDDWDLTWEEKLKKYQGDWPDGQSEIDTVCEACRQDLTSFCRWHGNYFHYCETCKCRISFSCPYSMVKEAGFTKKTVLQIADDDFTVRNRDVRGPVPVPLDPAIKALRALPYAQYLESEHWKKTREAALERWGWKCAACGSKWRLQVHHLYYHNLGCEEPSDLQVLCKACHEEEHKDSIEHRKSCGFTTTVLGLPIGSSNDTNPREHEATNPGRD